MNLMKLLFFYVCYFSDLSLKSWLSGVCAQNLKTGKLDGCERCKTLTASFNHWLDKTSRGKYEGGDAAWEEAKLKSYSRSEIRFVEIQEGLCSELSKHQHDCYMLAEEAEQMLEQWWFHEEPNALDLRTWLCIDTLKNCCPSNHYGEYCTPCSLDKDNKICNGHGHCDGEGTRTGNGTCICNKGYVGVGCEDCAKDYYEVDGLCEKCSRACDGCTGPGSGACTNCKSGWVEEGGECIDIDECLSPSVCKSNQFCLNKVGSYVCKKCDESCQSCVGAGHLNCTSCEPNKFYLWNGKCIPESLKADIIKNAMKQMSIYIGLFLITGILFKISKSLAALTIIILALYIYYTEITLQHASTYDVYFRNFGGKDGA